MLGRGTQWRQGSVLSDQDAVKLGLILEGQNSKVVILTHDCDLASDHEEFVEVCICDLLPAQENQYIRANHIRCLHLKYRFGDAATWIELRHDNSAKLPRVDFNVVAEIPDHEFVLPAEEKGFLKDWLVARYGRSAFPDSFESRLRRKSGNKKIEDRLSAILKKDNSHILGIFFDLDENSVMELEDGEPYTLKVVLIYDAIEGGPQTRTRAEEMADEIRVLFCDSFGPPEDATEIALEGSEAVAAHLIPLAEYRKLTRWRFEHISRKEDPPGNYLGIGR